MSKKSHVLQRYSLVLFLTVSVGTLLAQGSPSQGHKTRDLTRLSLKELANLEVTTVGKKPQPVVQTAAAISVLTAEEIRRSGATSIPEALRLVPGVQVARIDSNKWAIGVRGFASRLSRSMLVLIDGRSVYTLLFAGTYWEVQDILLEDIDRIEVIRGPGGTLWGANAVNGIVNIITKDSAETQGGLVTIGGGSFEQGFAGFRYGGHAHSGVNYRVYGKFFNRDAFFHRTGTDFDDWRMGQMGFRMDSPKGRDLRWTFQGDLYRGESGQRASISSLTPPFQRVVGDNATLAGGNLLSRWIWKGSKDVETQFQAYYDRSFREEPTFREERDSADLDFQQRRNFSQRYQVIYGLQYRISSGKFTGAPTIKFLPDRRTDNLLTGFLHNEFVFGNGLAHLTFGAKFEWNSYSGMEFQPTTRLLFFLSPGQSLWASFTRGVRTPSRVEHDLLVTSALSSQVPVFSRIQADKSFVSERLFAYEAGYRWQAAEKLSVSTSFFVNRHPNLLSVEPGTPFVETTPPPPPRQIIPISLRNLVEGKSYGAEISSDWLANSRLKFNINYSFLVIDLKNRPGGADPNTARSTEGNSPRHQVSARSLVNLPHNLELDMAFRHISALPSSKIDGYSTVDLRFGWRAAAFLELSVVGKDLLQPRHGEFGGGVGGLTEVERSAYGKVLWRW
ncbi:MAG TPA: TonB-dependent receptor [Acidobacteriota bacterium]|jgi:iron complex outermembrane receptor protein